MMVASCCDDKIMFYLFVKKTKISSLPLRLFYFNTFVTVIQYVHYGMSLVTYPTEVPITYVWESCIKINHKIFIFVEFYIHCLLPVAMTVAQPDSSFA